MMKKTTKLLLSAAAALSVLAPAEAKKPYSDDWGSLINHDAAPQWFADAKVGIYFHWGVYSVPAWGTEWYPRWMYTPDRVGWGGDVYDYHRKTYGEDFEYHDFIPMWKAPKFDAKEWVDLFEDSGAKFIGSIAEHHDGFSLWDSKCNEFNSVDMGPEINVVKEIADETRRRDLKFMATFHHGFNHIFYAKDRDTYDGALGSHVWLYDDCEVPSDPKYRKLYSNMPYDEANDLWLEKLDEVIKEFCPDYIWMDFGQRYIKSTHLRKFLQHYFNEADKQGREVVVNTKGDYFPTDLAVVNVERATMADITPDVWITDFIVGSAWCYNQASRVAFNPDVAVRKLADVVSKNGVMLLSAGPMADGTMPEEQVAALLKFGEWLKLYGEAIYNTRPYTTFGQGPTKLTRDLADEWNIYGGVKKGLDNLTPADIRYTYDQQRVVYAIQCGWADDGITHTLAAFTPGKVTAVEVLGSSETIKWHETKQGLVVEQPAVKPERGDAAIVYKLHINQ